MKLALLVYLASVVNGISLILILSGLALTIYGICKVIYACKLEPEYISKYASDERVKKLTTFNESIPDIKKKAAKIVRLNVVLCLCLWFVAALIPTEKNIYLMAGAYATEQITSNERVQKIGSDVLEVIETKLTELKETEK